MSHVSFVCEAAGMLPSSCYGAKEGLPLQVAPDQQYVTAAGHQHQLVDQQYMTAEEWYPNTDEAPTGHEGLHELQQQATMQKLSAVQPLLKWLKANQAEVTDASSPVPELKHCGVLTLIHPVVLAT